MSRLNLLPHSTTNPKYLESNSTSHVWVFGAIAELIDNSMDAGATQLDITVEKLSCGNALLFTDNGKGMQMLGLHEMLSFGHCNKNEKEDIGRYGNGFKSGSMRVGLDALVFSRLKGTLSLGFLSQTFLKATNAPEVFVPIVSWDANTLKLKSDSVSGHKSSSSLDVILEHSPYKTEKNLLKMFDRIKSPSGTCIVIYNLKHQNDSNIFELDFKDKEDIKITATSENPNMPPAPEHVSLRAYCAILFLNPTMAINLRGKRVQTVRVSSTLLSPKRYTYTKRNIESGQHVTYPVVFGFTPKEELKHHYGVMMYYNNRLIKGYVHVGTQLVHTNSIGKYIVGVIEANWLQPTHNKQDFFLGQNYAKQYELMITALGEKLKQYVLDLDIKSIGLGEFTKEIWGQTKSSKGSKSKSGKSANNKKRAAKAKQRSSEEEDEEEEEEKEKEGEEDNVNNTPNTRRTRLSRTCTKISENNSESNWDKIKATRGASSEPGRRVVVACTSCFKWRFVSENLASNLPEDWTCKDNEDSKYNKCSAPQEDPESEIPKAPRRRESSLANIPIEDQIEELQDELDDARTQFAKKDRKRERKLFGLLRMQDPEAYPAPSYQEEIVGKSIYVYWRTHDEWFPGKIGSYLESKGTHKVMYKDGDSEDLYLDDEWIYFPDSSIPSNLPAISVTGTKAIFPVGNPQSSKKTGKLIEYNVDTARGRERENNEVTQKRTRSRSPDDTPTKRAREEKSKLIAAEAELSALRASVKKFLQHQYPAKETVEDKLIDIFTDHVNNMENENDNNDINNDNNTIYNNNNNNNNNSNNNTINTNNNNGNDNTNNSNFNINTNNDPPPETDSFFTFL